MVENDPYVIYKLRNCKVSIQVPERFGGRAIDGVVEFAYRNLLDKQVELVVDNTRYIFPIPDVIAEVDGDIAFVYGESQSAELTADDDDAALFEELRSIAIEGGNIDDAISNLETSDVVIVWIRLEKP